MMRRKIAVAFLLWSHGVVCLTPDVTPSLVVTRRSPLFARWRSYPEEDEVGGVTGDGSLQRSPPRVSTERPTLTMTDTPQAPIIPDKPKILVLGATGKIGRRVVRQLLERSSLDATIVACCRDYDKACRVLYDDLLVLASHSRGSRRGRQGPKLQIVQLDLVPPEELPGFSYREEADDEAEWLRRATSAASFYQTSVSDYDNRKENPFADNEEALQEAIKGCSAIISCLGAVRPTNFWTDILSRPFLRLLRHDVSSWCTDPRHPYYVHYCSTRKVLACAEREQLRREAAAAAEHGTDGTGLRYSHKRSSNALTHVGSDAPTVDSIPRIRFIRISDLCVSQPPWAFVPWLVNVFQSLVFRYQSTAEQLLESSPLLETIVLRPGDLVDELRDENTTHLQVGIDGCVPSPSIVGRDDVAALAVAAALFDTTDADREAPFHYTLGVRWVGEDMDPYPSQGSVSDGLPSAQLALQSALRNIRRRNKYHRRKQILHERSSSDQSSVVRFARRVPDVRKKIGKPYAICVAFPVYIILALVARRLVLAVLPLLPSIVQDAATSVAAFGASALAVLFQGRIPQLLARLPSWHRGGIHKYISF